MPSFWGPLAPSRRNLLLRVLPYYISRARAEHASAPHGGDYDSPGQHPPGPRVLAGAQQQEVELLCCNLPTAFVQINAFVLGSSCALQEGPPLAGASLLHKQGPRRARLRAVRRRLWFPREAPPGTQGYKKTEGIGYWLLALGFLSPFTIPKGVIRIMSRLTPASTTSRRLVFDCN
jgi:hypothetical protein